jgi:hypothetical protein
MLAAVAVLAYATYRFYNSDTKKEEVEDDFVVIDEDPETLRRFVFFFLNFWYSCFTTLF